MLNVQRTSRSARTKSPGWRDGPSWLAQAVDAFDAVELDVAGGARAAEPGLRSDRVEQAHGAGHVGDDVAARITRTCSVGRGSQRYGRFLLLWRVSRSDSPTPPNLTASHP